MPILALSSNPIIRAWETSTTNADLVVDGVTLTGLAAAAYQFGQALRTVIYPAGSDGLQLSDGQYEFPPGSVLRVSLAEVADALYYKYGVDPIIEFSPGLGTRGVSVADINTILAALNREFAGQFYLQALELDTVASASANADFFQDVVAYLDGLKTKANGLAGFIQAREADAQVRAQRYADEGLTELKDLALGKADRYTAQLAEISQGIAAMQSLRTSALNGGTDFQAVINAIKAQLAVAGLAVTDVFAWLKSFDIDPSLLWDQGQAKVSFGNPAVTEGKDLVYQAVLSEAPEQATEFSLAIDGSALAADVGPLTCSDGVTYDAATGKLTVPAGVGTFTITVPTIDDAAQALTRTLTLTLAGAQRTGTITDNDTAQVSSVSAEDAAAEQGTTDRTVTEGNALRYAVVLNAATVRPTALTLSVSGSATPQDYGAFSFSDGVTYDAASGKLNVPTGVSSFDITAPTHYNFVDGQQDRTLKLTVGGVASSEGTITDNEPNTVSALVAADPMDGNSIFSEGKPLVFNVTLAKAADWPTEFSFATSGSATSADFGSFEFSDGVTYNAQTGKLQVPAGVSSFSATAPTVNNSILQPDRLLNLTIGGVSATATIADTEAPSLEGNLLRYAVELAAAGEVPITFSLAVNSGVLSGAASSADYGTFIYSNGVTYDAASGKITVPAGVKNFTISVPTVDDSTDELTESLKLSLTNDNSASVSATVSILDNDLITVESVFPLSASVAEGATLRFTVKLSGTTANPVEFALELAGAAEAGSDFKDLTFTNNVTLVNGMVRVPAGVSSFAMSFYGMPDDVYEYGEALTVLLRDPLKPEPLQATQAIIDNDTPPVVSIVSAVAYEGDTLQAANVSPSLNFVVTLQGPADGPRRYYVERKNGNSWQDLFIALYSTINDPDFNFQGAGVIGPASLIRGTGNSYGYVTVPAGMSSFTVKVPIKGDTIPEGDESLVIRVLDGKTGVPGAVLGPEGQGLVVDNDIPTVTGFSHTTVYVGGQAVTEGAGAFEYLVTLSAATPKPLEMLLSVAGASTLTPDDYEIIIPTSPAGFSYDAATGKLTVPAGVSNFRFSFKPLVDNETESTESVTPTLTVGAAARVGASFNILDADTRIAVESVVPLASVAYEGSNIQFDVSLNGQTVSSASGQGMVAEFVLSGGATAADLSLASITISNGVTYAPVAGSSNKIQLTIPVGVSDFRISVPAVSGDGVETGEAVRLRLFSTYGEVQGFTSVLSDLVSIKEPIAVLSVKGSNLVGDAMGVTTLVATSTDRVQEGGALTYAVTLSAVSDAESTLPISISGTVDAADYGTLTFTNGVTYDVAAGLLRIPPNTATFSITVPTRVDGNTEVDPEALVLRVGGAGELGRSRSATIADVFVAGLFGVRSDDAAAYADPDRQAWNFAALDWSKSGWNISALNPNANVSEVKAAIASFERGDLFGEFDWGRWKGSTENLKTNLALTSDLWVTAAIPTGLRASGVVGYSDSALTAPAQSPLSDADKALLAASSNLVLTPATAAELHEDLTEGGDIYVDRNGAFYINGVRTRAVDLAVTSRVMVQENLSVEYKTMMDALAERNNMIASARTIIGSGSSGISNTLEALSLKYGQDDVLGWLTAGQYSDDLSPIPAETDVSNNWVRFAIDPGWTDGTTRVQVNATGSGLSVSEIYRVEKIGDNKYEFYLDHNNTIANITGDVTAEFNAVTLSPAGESLLTDSNVAGVSLIVPYLNGGIFYMGSRSFSFQNDPLWATGTRINVNQFVSNGAASPLFPDAITMLPGISYYVRSEGNGQYGVFDSLTNANAGVGDTGRIYVGTNFVGDFVRAADAVTFNPDPEWSDGAQVRVTGTQGGLTPNTSYYVRRFGVGSYLFFDTAAHATAAGTPRPLTGLKTLTGLIAQVNAVVTESVVGAAGFAALTAVLNTLISNKVRDGDLDQAKLQAITGQLQNNTEAMTALIKAFSDLNASLVRALG